MYFPLTNYKLSGHVFIHPSVIPLNIQSITLAHIFYAYWLKIPCTWGR